MGASIRHRAWLAVAGVAALVATACGGPDRSAITSELQRLTASAASTPAAKDVWADVQRFYEQRAHAPQWVGQDDDAPAEAALRVLQHAPEHGLARANYDNADLPRLLASDDSIAKSFGDDAAKLAQLDLRITASLLALGRDVSVGRLDPASIDKRWKKARTVPDLAGTLGVAAAAGTLDQWLDTVRPQHPEYAALQKAAAAMRARPGEDAGDDRATQLALNMERWRWLPDDLGDPHILVNVPAFQMAVREGGRPVVEMKVVVGTPDHATPIFSDRMKTIVFSPYWNVPESIAEGETAPAVARDPQYLSRNNIEILRRGSKGDSVVDPGSVDWDDPAAIKTLAFRQKPGPGNALGHVKFLFPNPYDVYLHDTPADGLFARQGRALSHGCVRLERPEALAEYLLRDEPKWDADRIRAAMHKGEEEHVAMKQHVPVHIVYFTAWPDAGGGVHTFADVYGLDAKQLRAAAAR